jgi:hypothetical protein
MTSNIGALALAILIVIPISGACGAGETSTVASEDLASIVIPPASPPAGMTLSSEGRGRATLERLPLFPQTAAALIAQPGFVDGRWTDFAGSPDDFAASTGFVLTWVVTYASETQAGGAYSILREELESPDRYGWGRGDEAGLGDEGTCLEGDSPRLDGLHETVCLWRRRSLVMVVGGGSKNETPIPVAAASMDSRAATLLGVR